MQERRKQWSFVFLALAHRSEVLDLLISMQHAVIKLFICYDILCYCIPLWVRGTVRLGSRISPHRHRVVVEVHWRDAQGWRSISWVVATFNHVGGSFNLSMAAPGDVWIIPSFRIWGYMLHVEHISCVITNCGQLQWAIPSLFSIAL